MSKQSTAVSFVCDPTRIWQAWEAAKTVLWTSADVVDQIVVYKIDRLTRALADFAKLVERLDEAEASFVSVTQSFEPMVHLLKLISVWPTDRIIITTISEV